MAWRVQQAQKSRSTPCMLHMLHPGKWDNLRARICYSLHAVEDADSNKKCPADQPFGTRLGVALSVLQSVKCMQTRKAKQNSSVERVGARLPEEVVPLLAEALQIGKPVTESWGLKRFMVDFLLVCAMGNVEASPMLVDVDMLDELEKKRAEHVARRTNKSRQRRQQWRKEQQQQQRAALEGTERVSSGSAAAALDVAGGHAAAPDGFAVQQVDGGRPQTAADGVDGGAGAGLPHHGAMNLQHLGDREVHAWPAVMPQVQPPQYAGERQVQPAEHGQASMGHDMMRGGPSVGVLQPVAVAPQIHDAQHYWDTGAAVALSMPLGDRQGLHPAMHAQTHLQQTYSGGAPPYSGQVDQHTVARPLQSAGMHVGQAAQVSQQHLQQQPQAQAHLQAQHVQAAQQHLSPQQHLHQPQQQHQQQHQPHQQPQQQQPHQQLQQQHQHQQHQQQHMPAQIYNTIPASHMPDIYATESQMHGHVQSMPPPQQPQQQQQQQQPFPNSHYVQHGATQGLHASQALHQQAHGQAAMQQMAQAPQMQHGMHPTMHASEAPQQGVMPAASPPAASSAVPQAFKQAYPGSGSASPMHSQQHQQHPSQHDLITFEAKDMHAAEQSHNHIASQHAPMERPSVPATGGPSAEYPHNTAPMHGTPHPTSHATSPAPGVEQATAIDRNTAGISEGRHEMQEPPMQPSVWFCRIGHIARASDPDPARIISLV